MLSLKNRLPSQEVAGPPSSANEISLIAVNKIDLAEKDMLDLVIEDVRELVKGTFLEKAPLYPVSTVSGQGFEEFRQGLVRMVLETPERATGALVGLTGNYVELTFPGPDGLRCGVARVRVTPSRTSTCAEAKTSAIAFAASLTAI